MQDYINLYLIAVLILLVFTFWLIFSKSKDEKIKIRDASLTSDELEAHAREMAYDHAVSKKLNLFNWPVPRMNENYRYILSVYKALNEDMQKGIGTTPAAEWLLDNFYIIEEQVKGVRKDLTKEYYSRLPMLRSGQLKGYARIYTVALELVSHTDGRIDEKVLLNYINAYQSHNVLANRELWALAIMIKLALIENIRYICQTIEESQNQRRKVEEILSAAKCEEGIDIKKLIQNIEVELKGQYQVNSAFIEHLAYKLRKMGRAYSHVLRHIDDILDINGTNVDSITHKEHSEQTVRKGSIGNCIISLKFISSSNWVDIFEALSKVEDVLRSDPNGTYNLMDLSSKNYYRKRIEELALDFDVSEKHVANKVVDLATRVLESIEDKNNVKCKRGCHVGYYIIGEGLKELEKEIGSKKTFAKRMAGLIKRSPLTLYIGSVSILTILISALFSSYIFNGVPKFKGVLAAIGVLAVLVPATEVSINFINWILNHVFKPSFFPRIELKDSIPNEYSTMVVIPALLPDEKRAVELINNLEVYYLSNRENNLYFALAGDYKDSAKKDMENDGKIISAALDRIKELNKKYCKDSNDIFYFFHRHRQYNDRQKKWMGWERKRGALVEFNDMLLGSKKTSYSVTSTNISLIPKVKYVITLDADTILPLGTAKKLVGTMVHPLNLPEIDEEKGIVISGYGLMQPRIGFDIESVNKSLFSRIFAGEEGRDPYASAVSDVYQDLFGEGIFTGKGIYDIDVFQKLLANAIPENTVLSHDLLEGSYIRAGLVTDLELIDGYPSKYNSYAMRLHRWVRGDWQLLPWLRNNIRNRSGKLVKNPLSMVSRWKIIDNLRRSLIAPSLILLVALGFSIFPGNTDLWIGILLFINYFPFILSGIDYLVYKPLRVILSRRYTPVICGLKAAFLQITLQFLFLPYQAYLMVNAITITLARVLITKRNMLEWVTALDAEKTLKNSLKSYVIKMRTGVIEAIVLLGIALLFKQQSVIPAFIISVAWLLSPFVAYKVSREEIKTVYPISNEDLLELRAVARKTWRYYEEFVNNKNNYLAPDNYQEDPPNGIAYRTSPTNIGLGMLAALCARDFGYIGTDEMYKIVKRTVSTIEKMDKWNGHLYNWYDTRTLNTLRPRYISTVDSGNFVCYLITLKEGLIEYLNRPLIEKVLVNGIKDTVNLSGKETDGVFLETDELDDFAKSFDETGRFDLALWSKALDRIVQNQRDKARKINAWSRKVDYMVSNFKEELRNYYSWSYLLFEVPEELKNGSHKNEIEKPIKAIFDLLKVNVALVKLPEHYRVINIEIDKLNKNIAKNKESSFVNIKNWLDRLKHELEKSAQNVEQIISNYRYLIDRIDKISCETEFIHLYDNKKQLFSIGYNIEENSLTNSYYDLLASEARQTSYIAIARGEVDAQHWFKLGRTLTRIDRYKGMISWSGTMFEYLMPLLIMKSVKNTLLDETYSFVLRSQKKYAKQRNVPWGTSESGFYSFDIKLDYQYKAFGVPWLGLKRGLAEDMVVAPYSTMLALPVDPHDSVRNLKKLAAEGANGPYGYYEAIDYTPERLPIGSKYGIVKSYMAHHQGMSILALNNYLNGNIMQRRFHNDPVVDAAKLLLQEKVPTNILFTKENKERILPFTDVTFDVEDSYREYDMPDYVLPKAHILSNGSYSVMLTDRGTGYSRSNLFDVTRWREDITLDNYGVFFYVRNTNTNEVWSSAYAPVSKRPDKYKVTFTSGMAKYHRKDGDIDTVTEVVVSSGDNAEIRRVTFVNHGSEACVLEVSSYFELVLTQHGADVAHPAFSNLFIRTQFIPELNCLIASRRPRSENDKTMWAVNVLTLEGEALGGIQYETDRFKFIGRGRDVSDPQALEPSKPLSNSVGAVLDPIMGIRYMIRIDPGKTAKLNFIVALAESREAVLEIASKYSNHDIIPEEFNLAATRSRVEARYLNLKTSEIEFYQELISHILFISPAQRLRQECIINNTKGQPALWPYGISGDIPIVLVKLEKTDEIDIIYEILKAHEYWKYKNLKVDLVILNEEENSYTNPLNGLIADILSASHAHDMINKPGGVFVLRESNLPKEDVNLICAAARIVLSGNAGDLKEQLNVKLDNKLPELKVYKEVPKEYDHKSGEEVDLQFYNGIGGFNKDGKEYEIFLKNGASTPLPWSNVISNPKFGFLVTESGSGYTWHENSRENKLTPWSNDPVSDTPGEIIYLSDDATGEIWNITPLPIRENGTYTVIHGFGYSIFRHSAHGFEQELTQFVPVNENIKLSLVKLKNVSDSSRVISLYYYIRPVLGVNDQVTASHISTQKHESGAILIRNTYNEEFYGRVAFVDTSAKERTFTCDRKEFFGGSTLSDPPGIRRAKLTETAGAGFDPCTVICSVLSFKPGEEKEIVFTLGEEKSIKTAEALIFKYRKKDEVKKALKEVEKFWKEKLESLQFSTPDRAMDYMLNGWLLYQALSCRMWTRTGFYQSGGAYGFRDQLQDCLSIAHIMPEITREQILLHSKHQFVEGDVQHWWHEEKYKGTRTRFSDDLLWMPYVAAEYIRITGDTDILKVETPFLEDEPLKDFEDESYRVPRISNQISSIYDHCIRAIERSLKFGDHGIPLIGSGDWNDGMNTVGNKGRGESVWLGWFLYSILMKFAPICRDMGEEDRAERYISIAKDIARSIEENAWDGNWYRRAYFDNGHPLGSIQNSECQIDSLAQSWAVISGAGDRDRINTAMNALENYLIKRDEGLIKLLTPPFDEGDLEPGYIKSYVPGVRENGGQYTHAASWVVMAVALLGDGDKASELFGLLNPINHAKTYMEYSKYKVEPYVLAADVYSVEPHTGRGGWTWYTGAAGWMYRVGMEYILGFKKNGDGLSIDPCIPKGWTGFDIKYKYKDTFYRIAVKNPDGVNKGIRKIIVDEKELNRSIIELIDDKKEHSVEVIMGRE
ncbi:GH36-type glycosyl hydrolase domain-containing protein [Acetivibrio cellulolyticus]|uniref:GH36-type glycosyl hydrolase domain-containing protein n=1 Tax=Acetivibrio cellulolyticus TaxID=35830 RepID=UPI0001E2D179|nr:glucoamylase family protein [Acetivibrio cellulolyticus]